MTDYTDDQTFAIGDRVEIHPGYDLWMQGARFGTVTAVNVPSPHRVQVKLDRLDKYLTFMRDRLRHATSVTPLSKD